MNKLKGFLLLLVGSAALAQVGQYFTASLSAAGTTSAVQVGAVNHTLQVNVTATPSACAIQLEGSLDNVNWQNLSGSQSCTSSTMFHVDGKPITWVRANLTSFTGSGNVTILYRGSN